MILNTCTCIRDLQVERNLLENFNSIYIDMYTYMYMYIHMYIYMYICMYIYIYMYICICEIVHDKIRKQVDNFVI